MIKLNDLMTTDEYEDGGWVDDPPGLKGISLKVRNIGCRAFKQRQADLIDELPRAAKVRGLSQRLSEHITGTCVRETLLLDWKGIEHEGKELPYSAEWAEKLMASPLFRDAVAWAANLAGMPGANRERDARDKEMSDAIAAGVKSATAEAQQLGGSA